MSAEFLELLASQTEALKAEGLFKKERLIAGPQQAAIGEKGAQNSQDIYRTGY